MKNNRFTHPRLAKNKFELWSLFSLRKYLYWLDHSQKFRDDLKKIKEEHTLLEFQSLAADVFDKLHAIFEGYFIPLTDLNWSVIGDYLVSGRKVLEHNYVISMNLGFNDPKEVFPAVRQADLVPSVTIDIFGKVSEKEFKDIWRSIKEAKPFRNVSPESKTILPYVGLEQVFFGDDYSYNSRIENGIDGLMEVHRLKLNKKSIGWKAVLEYLKAHPEICRHQWTRDTLRMDYYKFKQVIDSITPTQS